MIAQLNLTEGGDFRRVTKLFKEIKKMGMFDYIKVHSKWIPDDGNSNDDYQTKSFDNLLDQYKIDENGELFKMRCKDELMNYEEPIFHKYSGEIDFRNTKKRYKAWMINGLLKEIIEI